MLFETAPTVPKSGQRSVHSTDLDLLGVARDEERLKEVWPLVEAQKWTHAPSVFVGGGLG